jgi:dGTPase
MKADGGFEHNAQSYRIVTHLEDKYPAFRGLNLSFEVLEGVDKHRTRYDRPLDALGEQYTLEAQIVDLADEIAYTSHDLDDGLTSGLLDFDGLDQNGLWKRNFEKILDINPGLPSNKVKYQTVRSIINEEVTDLLTEADLRIRTHGIQTLAQVRSCSEELVSFSPSFRKEHLEMKRYLFQNMYKHPKVARMEWKSNKVLKDLFTIYEENPEILPGNTREKVRMGQEPLRRIICDYIAGMTDRFAIEEFEKLTDPSIRV